MRLGLPEGSLIVPGQGGVVPKARLYHPEVALDFARWANPQLAVQLSAILLRYVQGTLALLSWPWPPGEGEKPGASTLFTGMIAEQALHQPRPVCLLSHLTPRHCVTAGGGGPVRDGPAAGASLPAAVEAGAKQAAV